MPKLNHRIEKRMSGEIMDIRGTADFLGFSVSKVKRLFKDKTIPAKKIGAQWRCRRIDIDKFMAQS